MSSDEISYPPFPGLGPAPPQMPPPDDSLLPLSPEFESHPPPDPLPQLCPPQPSPPELFRKDNSAVAVSPLNQIPADIAIHRGLLFALDTPVELAPAVWDRFWPYIDNVWCIHQKPHPCPKTGIAKVYGACRLSRKTNFPLPEIKENSRPRQRREGGTCKAKFRLTIGPDGRRLVERTGEGHSHTLDYIDGVKRNTGVRNLVLNDFFKSWEAGGILAFLRDTSSSSPTDILRDAGGLYLGRQEVQNILNGALKKAYPGQDIAQVKKQMDKYKNYTTCNYKGCSAPAFAGIKDLMVHRREVHGLKNHDHSDKMYACPDKACWRRKKSKGFTTLLGLEEHLREKHGSGAQLTDISSPQDETLEQTLADHLSGANASMFDNDHPGSMSSLLPDPITPDSSNDDQPRQMLTYNTDLQVGALEAERVFTHFEKEKMKVRIKRLEIEKQKLDLEIRRLKKTVWGDEVDRQATTVDAG